MRELYSMEKTLLEENLFTDALFNAMREGCLVLDNNYRVKAANESFHELFKVEEEETSGKLLFEMGNHQWDIPKLRELLEEILPNSKEVKDYMIEHNFESIGRRIMILNAKALNNLQLILLAIEDATDRTIALEDLNTAHKTLEDRVRESTSQISKLVRRLTKSELAERRRISAILHDDLQQFLVAIQMNLNHIQWKTETDVSKKDLSEEISEMIKLSDQAIEKTRRLTSDLNPSVLKSKGLTDILNWLTRRFYTMHELKIDLKISTNFIIHDMELRVILLQVIRELLFNIIKHAGTNSAVIEVPEPDDGYLTVHIIDHGKGFDMEQVKKKDGFGLSNVYEQMNLHSGDFQVDSEPGRGTRMTIRLPVKTLNISNG